MRRKTDRIPDIKVRKMVLPVSAIMTSSTFEEKPAESIAPLTIAVAMAIPVTLPEFRARLTKADVTPYLFPVAEEKMAALLGDINIPDPELIITMDKTTNQIGVLSAIKAISNNPQPASNNPKVVKGLIPYLSDRLPLSGPKMMRLIAFGMSTHEICAGVSLKAA
jgi:hypothetical protein|tara:strand:+ start:535 stop:1029 length:495 start_codon:yes stop_codon:yes gene_type:complete